MCELGPAPADHIAVQRIEFHEERLVTGLLAADQSRTRPAEEVEDILALGRRLLDRAHGQLKGLFCAVYHALRADDEDAEERYCFFAGCSAVSPRMKHFWTYFMERWARERMVSMS